MRINLFALAAIMALLAAAPDPAAAQTTPSDTSMPAAKRSRGTSARPKREPTAGQMAFHERQKKCGAEWREAKGKGATGGLKWPQYFSKCNARLKGSQV